MKQSPYNWVVHTPKINMEPKKSPNWKGTWSSIHLPFLGVPSFQVPHFPGCIYPIDSHCSKKLRILHPQLSIPQLGHMRMIQGKIDFSLPKCRWMSAKPQTKREVRHDGGTPMPMTYLTKTPFASVSVFAWKTTGIHTKFKQVCPKVFEARRFDQRSLARNEPQKHISWGKASRSAKHLFNSRYLEDFG